MTWLAFLRRHPDFDGVRTGPESAKAPADHIPQWPRVDAAAEHVWTDMVAIVKLGKPDTEIADRRVRQPIGAMSNSKLDRAISDAVAAVQHESYGQHDSIWRARAEVGDLLFALVTQGASDVVTTEAQARRISLTANLVQSSSVVKDLVSSGFYWSAAAVLRQYMETLARSIEIRSGRHTAGTKTPNVSVLPFRLSKNHGRLSALVHTSGGESLADFAQGSGAPEAATVMPRYHEQWAGGLLCLHVAQLVTLAREIDLLHRELYPGRQLIDVNAALAPVVQALVDAGFWEYLPAPEDLK